MNCKLFWILLVFTSCKWCSIGVVSQEDEAGDSLERAEEIRNQVREYTIVNLTDSLEYQLHQNLFSEYNPSVRPRLRHTDTVDVELEYELITVTALDEVNQELTSLGFVVATWYDDFLTWSIDTYENLTHISLPAEKLWLPDIGFENSAESFTDSRYWKEFRADLRHDGRVIWKFGGNMKTSCTLDMTYYPFDKQKCDIIIENWAYFSALVNLTSPFTSVVLRGYSENGEWAFDHSSVTMDSYEEDTHPGELFPRVTFSLFLTRKFTYYFINIILPASFIIVIALMVFWLPPDSGEKVSLGVTVLLAFSVFLLVIMEHTPKTSDYTPLMIRLFSTIMGTTTFSVMVSITVLYYHHHGPESHPPRFIRYLAFKVLARLVCMKEQVKDVGLDLQQQSDKEENQAFTKTKNTISPASENGLTPRTDSKLNSPLQENKIIIDEAINDDVFEHQSKGNLDANSGNLKCTDDYLRAILQCMSELKQEAKEKKQEEEILQEWKCIGMIFDRVMFWFAFVVLVIAVPSMLIIRDEDH